MNAIAEVHQPEYSLGFSTLLSSSSVGRLRQVAHDTQLGCIQQAVSGNDSILQDGHSGDVTRQTTAQHLASQSGSPGYLPPCSLLSFTPEVSTFFFRGVHYPWRVLPLAFHGPVTIHHNLYTDCPVPSATGHQLRPFLRRLPHESSVSSPATQTDQIHPTVAPSVGMVSQRRKSHLLPTQDLVFIGGRFLIDRELGLVPQDRWT